MMEWDTQMCGQPCTDEDDIEDCLDKKWKNIMEKSLLSQGLIDSIR